MRISSAHPNILTVVHYRKIVYSRTILGGGGGSAGSKFRSLGDYVAAVIHFADNTGIECSINAKAKRKITQCV